MQLKIGVFMGVCDTIPKKYKAPRCYSNFWNTPKMYPLCDLHLTSKYVTEQVPSYQVLMLAEFKRMRGTHE